MNDHFQWVRKEESNRPTEGLIRVFYTVPDGMTTNTFADDLLIAANLSFANYSEYTPLNQGNYALELYEIQMAGLPPEPLLSGSLVMNPDALITLAITNLPENRSFFIIPDSDVPDIPGEGMLRLIHLSPDTPPVDLTFSDGTVLFSNIGYKEMSPYASLPPRMMNMEIRRAGTNKAVLTVPNVLIAPDRLYTIYVVGLSQIGPELEWIMLLDSPDDEVDEIEG